MECGAGAAAEPKVAASLLRLQHGGLRVWHAPHNLPPSAASKTPAVLISPPQGLLMSITNEVTRRLLEPVAAEDFSRQHLANLVWALATLEYDPGGWAGWWGSG